MEIGTRLRRLRHLRDWTQEELAAQAGISKRNISRYESGNVEPRKSTLLKLAQVLDVTCEELTGSEPINSELPDDPELIQVIRGLAELPGDKKEALLKVINIVIREHRIQSAIAS